MKQRLLFDEKSREKLGVGINKIAKAVSTTLGGGGRNVIIDSYNPQITKDGVTVARSIVLEDPVEQMGARLIINVAQQVNDIAGDGTTTATVLAAAMFNEGIKAIESGINPSVLKRQLDDSINYVIEEINKIKIIDDNIETLRNIAKVSANGDTEISDVIIQAISHKKDGVITISESQNIETTVVITDGMQFQKGFIHPYFSNQQNNSCVFEKPLIMLANKPLRTIHDVKSAMDVALKMSKPLVIIANEFSEEIIRMLLINKVQGVLQCCAVKSPAHGELRRDVMEDIRSLIGGKLFDTSVYEDSSLIDTEDLGQAELITINNYTTTIISKNKPSEERVELLRNMVKTSQNEYDRSKFQERLSKLVGGLVQIKVGGISEIEIKEKKDRFEDALNAVRASIETGIIPGAGVPLYRIAQLMPQKTIGDKIVKLVIQEPFNRININAGYNPKSVFKMLKNDINKVFDVVDGKVKNFSDAGIIDPAKVSITALKNVVSIIGLLLTTDCVVYNIQEKEKENGN